MFDFSDAEQGKVNKFLNPGIHNVKVAQIVDGVASTGAPYLEFTIEDKEGLTSSNRLYLNTAVSVGSTKSAWDITKAGIVNLIAAINNTTFDEAKSKLPKVDNAAQLSAELAKMTVGKPFDIRLNGKEIPGKDGKQNWIKAEFHFSNGTVAPSNSKSLTYDPAKHIKKLAPSQGQPGISNSVEPTW